MTVREVFEDMKCEKHDTADFKAAVKLVGRCVALATTGEFKKEGNTSAKKFRVAGAGPPKRALDVRYALFEYFVNVRNSLKARLPKKIFLAKAKCLYQKWVEVKKANNEEIEKPLSFSHAWLRDWCKEFQISTKHPNKRFAIKQEDRKRRYIK